MTLRRIILGGGLLAIMVLAAPGEAAAQKYRSRFPTVQPGSRPATSGLVTPSASALANPNFANVAPITPNVPSFNSYNPNVNSMNPYFNRPYNYGPFSSPFMNPYSGFANPMLSPYNTGFYPGFSPYSTGFPGMPYNPYFAPGMYNPFLGY